jgi:uncharacterized protein
VARRVAPLLAVVLLVAQLVPAIPQQLKVVGYAWILAPAVMQTDTGYTGTTTNVTVLVTEGWGDVYVSTYSLTQEDFQGAATAAARVVCNLLNLSFSSYNFYFKVVGPAVIVGGPSAGVAMAVAVYSALTGQPVNRSVMVTGMISPDGTVGPVGGVYEKAQAAAGVGAKVFLVPPGQSVVVTYRTVVRRAGPFRFYTTQPVTINLTEYAAKELGLRVVEISTIEDALRYFFGYKPPTKTVGKPSLSTEALSAIENVRTALLARARDELSNTRSYLNSSQLNSITRRLLSGYLSYSQQYLTRAEGSKGVEAIPLLTLSVASSRWVRMLVDYYLDKPLDSYANDVASRLSSIVSEAEAATCNSFLDLNFKVLAADLAVRASRLFNESAQTWSSDPATALQNLAVASAYLDEAELWLQRVQGGFAPDARQAAATYLSVARTTWSYVYSVVSQAGGDTTLVDLAGSYYRAATSFYSSGRSFLAAVAAAKAVALAEAALLAYQSSASGADVYLKISRSQADATASKVSNALVATYFINYSALAGSASDAISWLKHATHLGNLALELGQSAALPREVTPVQTQQPQQPQQPGSGQKEASLLEKIVEAVKSFLSTVARALRALLDWLSGVAKRFAGGTARY